MAAATDAALALAFQRLREYSLDQIVRAGMSMAKAVEQVRHVHPEEFQAPPPQGLLGSHPLRRSDMQVALSPELLPAVFSIMDREGGIPPLLAYIVVAASDTKSSPDRFFDADAALDYVVGVSQHEMTKIRKEVAALRPIAEHGRKFVVNRRQGQLSPVAKKVKAYLAKHRRATAIEVWEALKVRPPKGYAFMDNPQGKYVEKGVDQVMAWSRFRNLVSEHRPKN